ncbi:12-oxophytodienoate reductase [Nitrospirillum sp. BR 11164]|uniref:oxidoreductase n=1 Tax=Nitrospirillum sp. BR 11164 TaxID=3104324 RepID=UPI002B000C1C|nr:12-oxophytodienoate reductase [Nitrospirillum sp. BR 11164]MEA1652882.1 12-oxophytodienoate reductase [Nitrospirillum sp. BR 11164]
MEALFQPLTIRGTRLANRVVMAPMSRYQCPGGVPSAEVAAYYRRRAAAGVGLIITEGVGIDHPQAVDHPGVPRLHGEAALAGWRIVVDGVHAAGGAIWAQLWHQGPMWNVEYAGDTSGTHRLALRPSGIWGPADGIISIPHEARSRAATPTRPMTDGEIQDVIDAYARSALQARELGFDGIAVHGAHGYLIDSFLWRYTNRRLDRWGGDAGRRAAFGAAVIRAIRAAVGTEVPIALRLSQFKMQDYTARIADTPDELAALLAPLAEAGVDVFDGSQRFFDSPLFAGSILNLAGWCRTLTGRLAMTVGGVGFGKGRGLAKHIDDSQAVDDNLPLVIERFGRGEFDLVGVGRALLNDPEWLLKARAGQPFKPFDPENLKRLT